jgi:SAM-dependent methyltransferase
VGLVRRNVPANATLRDECPLCGSAASTLVDTQSDFRFFPDDVFRIAQCASCDLLYTLPRLSTDELAPYYPARYPEYADDVEALTADSNSWKPRVDGRKMFYGRSLYAEIHAGGLRRALAACMNAALRTAGLVAGVHSVELLPMKRSAGRCLHVGSGSGGRFIRLMRQGWQVAAVDVNAELMARWRRSSAAVTTFGEGIQAAHFDPGSFDVIFMTHVIEHLTDPVADLRRLSDWLAPDGTFVCELPLYGTLGWNLRPRFTYYDVPRHTIHLTAETLAALLRSAGFQVRHTVQVPDGWSFYYCDFKRFCLTGQPADCREPNIAQPPLRHRLFGWLSWLVRSSGNACVYAVKA